MPPIFSQLFWYDGFLIKNLNVNCLLAHINGSPVGCSLWAADGGWKWSLKYNGVAKPAQLLTSSSNFRIAEAARRVSPFSTSNQNKWDGN